MQCGSTDFRLCPFSNPQSQTKVCVPSKTATLRIRHLAFTPSRSPVIITDGMKKSLMPADVPARVPPGQTPPDKFPVLSYGPTPRFNPEKWDFRVVGLIAEPLYFNYQQ